MVYIVKFPNHSLEPDEFKKELNDLLKDLIHKLNLVMQTINFIKKMDNNMTINQIKLFIKNNYDSFNISDDQIKNDYDYYLDNNSFNNDVDQFIKFSLFWFEKVRDGIFSGISQTETYILGCKRYTDYIIDEC